MPNNGFGNDCNTAAACLTQRPRRDHTLLPLDGCRRFRGDVVDDAVDPFDFIDDVVRHIGKELIVLLSEKAFMRKISS